MGNHWCLSRCWLRNFRSKLRWARFWTYSLVIQTARYISSLWHTLSASSSWHKGFKFHFRGTLLVDNTLSSDGYSFACPDGKRLQVGAGPTINNRAENSRLSQASEPESSESHVDSDRCSTLFLSSVQVGDNDQETQSHSLPPTQPLVSLPLATSRNNPFVLGSYYWFHQLPPRKHKLRSNWRDADFFAGVVTSVSSKTLSGFGILTHPWLPAEVFISFETSKLDFWPQLRSNISLTRTQPTV